MNSTRIQEAEQRWREAQRMGLPEAEYYHQEYMAAINDMERELNDMSEAGLGELGPLDAPLSPQNFPQETTYHIMADNSKEVCRISPEGQVEWGEYDEAFGEVSITMSTLNKELTKLLSRPFREMIMNHLRDNLDNLIREAITKRGRP